jgi:hypothetical protein
VHALLPAGGWAKKGERNKSPPQYISSSSSIFHREQYWKNEECESGSKIEVGIKFFALGSASHIIGWHRQEPNLGSDPRRLTLSNEKQKMLLQRKINFLFRMCQPKFTNEFVRQNIIILLLLCIVSSWRLSDIVNGPIDDDDDMSFFTIWCLLPAAEWNPIWKEDDSFFDQSAFTVHAV